MYKDPPPPTQIKKITNTPPQPNPPYNPQPPVKKQNKPKPPKHQQQLFFKQIKGDFFYNSNKLVVLLGVLVERQMLCKFCQNPSFLGEWNTPKETQNLPEKICEVCNEKVDTDTLVQQREEKRGNFSHIGGWVNGHAMIEFFCDI